MAFVRATRQKAYLRLMWVAPSGRGKSYGGLWLISELASRIAGIDSELGSLKLYALDPGARPSTPEALAAGDGRFNFDVEELQEKTPQEYIEKIKEAAAQGYDGLLIDSASHAWMSALSAIDQMGGWMKAGKNINPLLVQLHDAIMSYPGHVVVTYRSKVKSVIEADERGRNTIRKVGLEPVARNETEYDFTFCFESDERGMIEVTKARGGSKIPTGHVFPRTDIPKVAAMLKAWLSDGAPVSAREALSGRIRLAIDAAALDAIRPDIKAQIDAGALTQTDREALLKLYAARKAELTQPAEVTL